MNIYDLQLSFGTEVPNEISLNIYFSGCKNNKKCDRTLCHNKQLHDFNLGYNYVEFLPKIKDLLSRSNLVSCICLLGGEPLDQDIDDLKQLCSYLRDIIVDIPVYCYTGYDYEDAEDDIIVYKKLLGIKDFYVGHFSPTKNNQYWLTTKRGKNEN